MMRLSNCNDPLLGRQLAFSNVVDEEQGNPVGLDGGYLVVGKFTSRLSRAVAGQKPTCGEHLGNGFSTKPGCRAWSWSPEASARRHFWHRTRKLSDARGQRPAACRATGRAGDAVLRSTQAYIHWMILQQPVSASSPAPMTDRRPGMGWSPICCETLSPNRRGLATSFAAALNP